MQDGIQLISRRSLLPNCQRQIGPEKDKVWKRTFRTTQNTKKTRNKNTPSFFLLFFWPGQLNQRTWGSPRTGMASINWTPDLCSSTVLNESATLFRKENFTYNTSCLCICKMLLFILFSLISSLRGFLLSSRPTGAAQAFPLSVLSELLGSLTAMLPNWNSCHIATSPNPGEIHVYSCLWKYFRGRGGGKKQQHFLTLCCISESFKGLISYSSSTYRKVLNGRNCITATAQILADKVSLLHLYCLLKKLLLYWSNN